LLSETVSLRSRSTVGDADTIRSARRTADGLQQGRDIPLRSLFTKHVPDELWADYLESRSDAAATEQIDAHLETGCKECAKELAEWRRLFGALEDDRSEPAVPEFVLRRAMNLFRAEEFLSPSVWQKIAASLVFDSRTTLTLAGARSAATQSFNLVYEASEASIYLWCERDHQSWHVMGQVVPASAAQSLIANAGSGDSAVELDGEGEFRLADLRAGTYDLTLRGTGMEINLPPVSLDG
jgi:hypothetical protein